MEDENVTAWLVGASKLTGVPNNAQGLHITGDRITGYAPSLGEDGALYVYELDLTKCEGEVAGLTWGERPRIKRRLRLTFNRGAAPGAADEGGAPNNANPDFDAITLFPWRGTSGGSGGPTGTEKERLVVFKSGSQEGLGDTIAVVEPTTGNSRVYGAMSLMTALRADARVTGAGAPLNIKAAAALVGGNWLALFNRGRAPGAPNSVVFITRDDFFDYLGALERAAAAADGSPGSHEDAAARVIAPKYSIVHLEFPPLTVPVRGGGSVAYAAAAVVGAATTVIRSRRTNAAVDDILLVAASHVNDGGAVRGTRLALLSSKSLLAFVARAPPDMRCVPELELEEASPLLTMPPFGLPAGSEVLPVPVKIAGVALRGAWLGSGGEDQIDALLVSNLAGEPAQVLHVRMRVPSGNW
jgi:hypothetical protein